MASIDLLGFDHVGIRYRDLATAERFWVEKVGLKVSGRIRAGVFLDVGDIGAHLACFQAEGKEQPKAPHHVALRIPRNTLGQALAFLRERGVRIEPIGPNEGFRDPEGNAFHFMEV